jgi:hypothetical protein
MPAHDDLEWLRDHGVQIDHKGRIIVSLPAIPDDDIGFDIEDREPSIAELMHHDINPRLASSRGRRRQRFTTQVQRARKNIRPKPLPPARIGRPIAGSEARIHVQTMIAQQTRDALLKQRLTLADVFDACAQELLHVPRG